MQLIFDYLAATIIFGAIILMLASVHARKQRVQVRAAGYYALRTQQLAFIKTLRRDMVGMICDESNLTSCPDFEVDPGDHTYTFHARLGGSSSTVYKVTYERTQVGAYNGSPLYQIQRYVDPPGSGTFDSTDPDGASASTITSWSVHALNEAGFTPTKKGDIRRIKVRFETVSLFADEGDARSHPWKAVYRPMYLQADKTL